MRIVSKKRDYYDSVQALGQDLSLVYIREPLEIIIKGFPFPSAPGTSRYCSLFDSRITAFQHVVGFCEVLYPVIQFWKPDMHQTGQMSTDEEHSVMCYSVADVDKFMHEYLKGRDLARYDETDQTSLRIKKRYASSRYRMRSPNHTGFEDFFELYKKQSDGDRKHFWHTKLGENVNSSKQSTTHYPIFVASLQNDIATITYNALLRPFHFARIKDPYTAFQDLRMWMSNQTSPERPIPFVSNDDRLHGHGFDKYSFRQDPAKSRGK